MAWLILLALGLLAFVATRAASASPADLANGRKPITEGDGAETDDQDSDGEAHGDGDGVETDGGDIDDPRGDGLARAREVADDDELVEPDRLADVLEDSAVDDPLLRDAIETGIVFTAGATSDAVELADLAERRQRPSRFGRLDLTVAWRRGYHVAPIGVVLGTTVARDATTYEHRIADTFLVFATWRI